jgi:hypothetical protein
VDRRFHATSDSPEKFPIEDTHNLFFNEIMIRSFNCALLGKILLQGKCYISNEAIYFYSVFNDRNLIKKGTPTKLRIPYDNIMKIEKAYNAKIFDNSIRITLKEENKRVFLTSFINRNNCYNLIVAFKK